MAKSGFGGNSIQLKQTFCCRGQPALHLLSWSMYKPWQSCLIINLFSPVLPPTIVVCCSSRARCSEILMTSPLRRNERAGHVQTLIHVTAGSQTPLLHAAPTGREFNALTCWLHTQRASHTCKGASGSPAYMCCRQFDLSLLPGQTTSSDLGLFGGFCQPAVVPLLRADLTAA